MFRRLFWVTLFLTGTVYASLEDLKQAYPDQIQTVSTGHLVWSDGSRMEVHGTDQPTLWDQVSGPRYIKGIPQNTERYTPIDDPGRIRYIPFFKKMYGATTEDVESHLVTVYWLSAFFGSQYPLRVTSVNGVDKQVIALSRELEKLVKQHPTYLSFLRAPEGAFNWRKVAGTDRPSLHSFGIAIDLNTDQSDYWQWDLRAEKRPISEHEPLRYRNRLPWEIVQYFENHGFIWGGKWEHYDTGHFEYRPELLVNCGCG